MKLFNYWYYFNFIRCKERCPEIEPHDESIRVMIFPLTMVLASLIFQLSIQLDIFNSIIENWPYDYGNVHSKNFTTPTAILVIVCYVIARNFMRSEYINKKTFKKSSELFQNFESTLKFHYGAADILIFYFIFIAMLIGFGLFKTLFAALVPLAFLEYWIRKNILKSPEKAC